MKNVKWLLAAILTAILLPAIPAYNVEASQNQDGFLFDGPDSNNQVTITGYEGTGGDVTVPDKLNGYTVWNIGLRAFENKSNLTSITLPDSISDMDPYVFSGCTNLEHVKLPDSLTRIPPNTFENCTNLKSIQLPEKLRNIGESAFRNCSSLTQIEIPNGVTQIKENAFYSCGQMKSIMIPASVTSIAWNAFQYCNSLDTIQIDDGNATYDSRNNCNAIIQKENHTLFIGCIGTTIPDSVAAIGEKAFYHCEGLTSIAIPASVKSIGKLAFSGCSGLTQLTLAEGVTGIGESAFVNCSALTNMMIPASVHEIGSSAFVNCTSLADVMIGDGVGIIGDRAFLGCNKLKSITIPASVQTIGNRAFGYKDDHADSNSNFIIHSDSGSAAEEYAKSNGITVQPIPAAKKDLSSATVTLEKSSYVYNQTACTPAVTVTLGVETLTQGTDYSVSYSNNIQPGTAKVTVTGKGQYMGSKTISFTITEAAGTPDPDQQQPGQEQPGQQRPEQQQPDQQQPAQQQPAQQQPTVSITCPKTVYTAAYGAKPFRIKASADGGLTWKSSNKKIADVDKKGKVTVKGTGIAVITIRSGSASAEVTVRVSPKKPSVSSAKAAKGRKLAVKWKKDKRATGYQVQLGFTKTFKKIEKKLDTKKNACTFKKLKTGKAYYVRIRSYKKSGREKVYSAWSKPKKGGSIKR